MTRFKTGFNTFPAFQSETMTGGRRRPLAIRNALAGQRQGDCSGYGSQGLQNTAHIAQVALGQVLQRRLRPFSQTAKVPFELVFKAGSGLASPNNDAPCLSAIAFGQGGCGNRTLLADTQWLAGRNGPARFGVDLDPYTSMPKNVTRQGLTDLMSKIKIPASVIRVAQTYAALKDQALLIASAKPAGAQHRLRPRLAFLTKDHLAALLTQLCRSPNADQIAAFVDQAYPAGQPSRVVGSHIASYGVHDFLVDARQPVELADSNPDRDNELLSLEDCLKACIALFDHSKQAPEDYADIKTLVSQADASGGTHYANVVSGLHGDEIVNKVLDICEQDHLFRDAFAQLVAQQAVMAEIESSQFQENAAYRAKTVVPVGADEGLETESDLGGLDVMDDLFGGARRSWENQQDVPDDAFEDPFDWPGLAPQNDDPFAGEMGEDADDVYARQQEWQNIQRCGELVDALTDAIVRYKHGGISREQLESVLAQTLVDKDKVRWIGLEDEYHRLNYLLKEGLDISKRGTTSRAAGEARSRLATHQGLIPKEAPVDPNVFCEALITIVTRGMRQCQSGKTTPQQLGAFILEVETEMESVEGAAKLVEAAKLDELNRLIEKAWLLAGAAPKQP